MERADLIKDNGKIFVDVGQALDAVAHPSLKAVVVGNPCNTNCLIASSKFKRLDKTAITAMSRLDHNRALSQLKLRLNTDVSNISNIGIFGNHSPTM
jgi:malate dehydrogenase